MSRRVVLRLVAGAAAGTGLVALSGCTALPRLRGAAPIRLTAELPADAPVAVRDMLSAQVADLPDTGGPRLDVTWASPDDLHRRYPPLAAARQAPDVAVVGTLGPAALYWGATLADLTSATEAAIRAHGEMAWTTRRAITYAKKLWGVPFYSIGWSWLVRDDVLQTLGIAEPKSYADVAKVIGQLGGTPRATAPWWLPLGADVAGESSVLRAVAAFGGQTADGSGQVATVATAEVRSALEVVAAMASASAVSVGFAPSQAAAVAAFEQGQLAMMPADAAYFARIARGAEPLPWTAKSLRAIVPLQGPKQRFTTAVARYFVVSSSCPDVGQAARGIAGLLSPAPLVTAMRKSDGAVIPAYSTYLHDPYWDGDPARQVFVACARGDSLRQMELIDFGHGGPASVQAATAADRGHLREAVRRMVVDGLSAPEAIKECQQRLEQTYQDAARAFAAVSRRSAPKRNKLLGIVDW